MMHLLNNAIDVLCWVIVLPTLGWLAYRSFEHSDDRRGLIYIVRFSDQHRRREKWLKERLGNTRIKAVGSKWLAANLHINRVAVTS